MFFFEAYFELSDKRISSQQRLIISTDDPTFLLQKILTLKFIKQKFAPVGKREKCFLSKTTVNFSRFRTILAFKKLMEMIKIYYYEKLIFRLWIK